MASTSKTMKNWWGAFRFHFVPPSFLPAVLGGVLAWAILDKFHLDYFLLTVTGVTINHIALNMTDDYFDFRHSVDRGNHHKKNPYSGGSGMLTGALIKPAQMKRAFIVGYSITVIIGLYLTFMRGWQVLAFGAFGMACAYFYSAPPIKYGYRGFGEISHLINFSFTIGMGSFFVQARCVSLEALSVLLPLGFMMFSMITINEIPDEKSDRAAGKQNLVVRFGGEKAVRLYGIGLMSAYMIILVSPILLDASYLIYISLLTIPMSLKAFNVLYRYYGDPIRITPANLLTIRVHNLTGILLITAYVAQGILDRRDFSQMLIPLIVLVIIYSPVALAVFLNSPSLESEKPVPGKTLY